MNCPDTQDLAKPSERQKERLSPSPAPQASDGRSRSRSSRPEQAPAGNGLWNQALESFHSRNFDRSRTLCEEILGKQPRHADALHLKGMCAVEAGDPEMGLRLLEASITADPLRSSFRLNTAQVLLVQGGPERAIAHLQSAAELDPESVEVLSLLGRALLEKGELDDALDVLHQALRQEIDHARTWLLLGKAYRDQNRLTEAILSFRATLSVETEHEADHTEAWFQLGRIFSEIGDLEAAQTAYGKVIDRRPSSIEGLHNLGDIVLKQGDLDRALLLFEKVLEIDPAQIPSLLEMGSTLQIKGELGKAMEICEQILSLDPENVEARMSLGILYLTQGNFAKGWRLFEARRLGNAHREAEEEFAGHPEWQGEPLQGKTIFVYPEQGFGDVLQFVRYLPLLRKKGARVLFRPLPQLESLFLQNDLEAEIVASEAPESAFSYDYYAPLVSLPFRFGTDLSNIPSPGPYLRADVRKATRYQETKLATRDLKIGIAWQGNPRHPNDTARSTSLSHFYPLCREKGVRVYSLQKGPGAEQLSRLPSDVSLGDLGRTFTDFSDTAAAIANLDLVISVDTAVAHLSAAMGKPTWILLPTVSDWRWLLEGDDSPWYGSVRLFRQRNRQDWPSVFDRVGRKLRALVRRRARRDSAKRDLRHREDIDGERDGPLSLTRRHET